MSKLNTTLLRQTLNYIKEHPQEWNQKEWRCGTTYCFAGTAVKLDGGEFVSEDSPRVYARPEEFNPARWAYCGFPTIEIYSRAVNILGLTDEQADNLFAPNNNLTDLEYKVNELIGTEVPEEPETPETPETPERELVHA
jgi:hypothetical protein